MPEKLSLTSSVNMENDSWALVWNVCIFLPRVFVTIISRGIGIIARAVSFGCVQIIMARVAPPRRIISTSTINPKPNAILIWLISLIAWAMISPVLTLSRYAISRFKTRWKRSSLIFFSTLLALPMRRLRHPYRNTAMARPSRSINIHCNKSVLLSKD